MPGHLLAAFEAERHVGRIERCRSDIIAAAAASGRRWSEAEAFALARFATAATLLAMVESRASASASDAMLRQAAAVLEDELLDAEVRVARIARFELSATASLADAIADFAGTIGDLDKRAPNGNSEPDPYLRRAPETPPLVEVLRQRTLEQYRGSVGRDRQLVSDHDVTGGTLLLVRDIVAELTGLPRNSIGAHTAFDTLGIDFRWQRFAWCRGLRRRQAGSCRSAPCSTARPCCDLARRSGSDRAGAG